MIFLKNYFIRPKWGKKREKWNTELVQLLESKLQDHRFKFNIKVVIIMKAANITNEDYGSQTSL